MLKLGAAIVGIGSMLAFPAVADPIMECSIGASSQVEIGKCLAAVEKDAEAALNQALGFAKGASTGLDAVTERTVAGPALEASQKTWVAYRDHHCDYVGATFGGGSGTGAAIRSCRIRLARERTDTLMEYAQ